MLMDLDLAIAKHSEWKTRLLAAITNNETLATATMAKDNCCALGKWLHGNPGMQFEALHRHTRFNL